MNVIHIASEFLPATQRNILPSILSEKFTATGNRISDKAKQTALARRDLLTFWKVYRQQHIGKKESVDNAFIVAYNTGAYYPAIHDILKNVSLKKLYRWQAIIGDSNDWTLLAPQYKHQATPRLNPIESQIFFGSLLTPNKLPIDTAYKFTAMILQRRGYKCDKHFDI